MNKMRSRAEAWQKNFDSCAYLDTFYGEDMFSHPDRFLGDYLSQIAEKMHSIMATGQIRLDNHLRILKHAIMSEFYFSKIS